jgi:hypothetical protein
MDGVFSQEAKDEKKGKENFTWHMDIYGKL